MYAPVTLPAALRLLLVLMFPTALIYPPAITLPVILISLLIGNGFPLRLYRLVLLPEPIVGVVDTLPYKPVELPAMVLSCYFTLYI